MKVNGIHLNDEKLKLLVGGLKSLQLSVFEAADNHICSDCSLAECLSQMKSLKRANFKQNNFSTKSFSQLTQALRANPQLESVDLSNNNMSNPVTYKNFAKFI